MSAAVSFTLSKQERICSKKLIEELFTGTGSRSMTAFPLRAVFLKRQQTDGEPLAAMLVSVPKRHFKRAVKRNRVKRQVREAFRRNKSMLDGKLQAGHHVVAIAFVWLADSLYPTAEVEHRVNLLLTRINERL